MFGWKYKYSVPFFIADMKKREGTDFRPTALRLQLQKFITRWSDVLNFLPT